MTKLFVSVVFLPGLLIARALSALGDAREGPLRATVRFVPRSGA